MKTIPHREEVTINAVRGTPGIQNVYSHDRLAQLIAVIERAASFRPVDSNFMAPLFEPFESLESSKLISAKSVHHLLTHMQTVFNTELSEAEAQIVLQQLGLRDSSALISSEQLLKVLAGGFSKVE